MSGQNSVRKTVLLLLTIVFLLSTAFAVASFSVNDKAVAQSDITAAQNALAAEHAAHDGWTALSAGGTIAGDDVDYYLTADISAIIFEENKSTYNKNFRICLNGHKITGSGGSAVYIGYGNNVTICDCNGSHSTHYYTVDSDGRYNFNASSTTSGAKSIQGGLITGGNAQSGGGICFEGGSLTLNAVTVAGNRATSGGGVSLNYGTATVNNCSIEGNVASSNGGGIYLSNTINNFSINSCTVANNRAGSNGGGVWMDVIYQMSFNNSTISGNAAQGDGGGFYVLSSAYSVGMNNVVINSNTSQSSGGGIYVSTGNVQITGSSDISSNTSGASVTSDDYASVKGGGGICAVGGSVSMQGGTIVGNKASSARGGGILATGTGSISLDGTHVSGNSAATGGGAYVRYSTTDTSQANFSVKGNVKVSDNAGSDVYLYSGTKNIIRVSGAFAGDALIGVTLNTSDGKGQFATGYDISEQNGILPSNYFFDNNGEMSVYLEGSNVELGGHIIDGTEYTGVTSSSQIVAGASASDMKYYYLKTDVVGNIIVDGYVTLDLNGKILKGDAPTSTITLKSGQLTVIDSQSQRVHYYTIQNVGYEAPLFDFNATADTPDAKSLKGGVITGGLSAGVSVEGGTFDFNGGTIAGNSANTGAGVYATGGTVNLAGGDVYGNASTGNVNINTGENAVLNVSGGIIDGGINGKNITISGGLFKEAKPSSGTVYGYDIAAESRIMYIQSVEEYPDYIDGYNYLVFGNSENIHDGYGIALTETYEVTSGAYIITDGYYYLAGDILLTSPIKVQGHATLCLHGHRLTNRSAILAQSPDSDLSLMYCLDIKEGASLTICSCSDGGQLTHGIYYDGAQDGASITVYSGYVGKLSSGVKKQLKDNLRLYGGQFYDDVSDYVDENHIAVTQGTTGTGLYGVYGKGTSSVSLNNVKSKTYDGLALEQGTDFDFSFDSYEGATVNIKVYTDEGLLSEVALENTVNAGTYYVVAQIDAKYDMDHNTYYPLAQSVKTLRVFKKTPEISVTVDESGKVYTTSEFPELTCVSDVEGTVAWNKEQNLTAGENAYKWTFIPDDDVNYNTVEGEATINVKQTELVNIVIVNNPYKTDYVAYETIDLNGIQVIAYLSDGSESDVTAYISVEGGVDSPLSYGTDGKVEITVSYTFTDGEHTDTKRATFEAKVTRFVVELPVAPSLVFNNTEQTAFEETEYYSAEGNTASALDAGGYVAVLVLKDKENCVWASGDDDGDGKISVNFKVEKATFDMSDVEFSDMTVEYDGREHSLQVSGVLPTDENGNPISVTYDKTGLHAGTYTVTATFSTQSDNYYKPQDMRAQLTVLPKRISVSWENTVLYANGGERAPVASAVGVNGERVNIEVSGAATLPGIYTATATSANGDYTLANDSVEFELLTPFGGLSVNVGYGELTVSLDGGNGGIEYSLNGGEWTSLAENGRIAVDLAASWDLKFRYASDTSVETQREIFTTADNVLIYLSANLRTDALGNKQVIDVATQWLSVASGDKTQAQLKLAEAQNEYAEEHEKLAESAKGALKAAAKLTGLNAAVAVAVTLTAVPALIAGAVALSRRGGKKDEKKL